MAHNWADQPQVRARMAEFGNIPRIVLSDQPHQLPVQFDQSVLYAMCGDRTINPSVVDEVAASGHHVVFHCVLKAKNNGELVSDEIDGDDEAAAAIPLPTTQPEFHKAAKAALQKQQAPALADLLLRNATFAFASPATKRHYHHVVISQNIVSALQTLSGLLRIKSAGSLGGQIWEMVAHDYLQRGGDVVDIRRLRGDKAKCHTYRVRLPSRRLVLLGDDTDITSMVESRHDHYYVKPLQTNFPSVDAMLLPGLCALQMSVSQHHPLKVQGLNRTAAMQKVRVEGVNMQMLASRVLIFALLHSRAHRKRSRRCRRWMRGLATANPRPSARDDCPVASQTRRPTPQRYVRDQGEKRWLNPTMFTTNGEKKWLD